MNTKHGLIRENTYPTFEAMTEAALSHRYTHIWVFDGEHIPPCPTNHDAYSFQVNERHGKVASVSVWKRGAGHVNIIFPHNSAWNPIMGDVHPGAWVRAIQQVEILIGVPIGGSPGGAGWELVKRLHPDWIEAIPVNLHDLHFTAKAGGDLIWQSLKQGQGLPTNARYIHKFDRRSAYPYTATQTDYGKGTPVHLVGEAAARASEHVKGHPQDVGVWRVTITYDGARYDPDMPPIWGEEKGTAAGSEGWLSGPIIRLLRAFGHEVTIHEGFVFPERHDLMVKWGNLLIQGREQVTGAAQKLMKQLANSTIGFTAYKGFDEDEDEKRRPDIRLQTVARQRELLRHNIQKVREETGRAPVMVYMDAVYYLSDEPVLTLPSFAKREDKPGGMRYEGSVEITPDIAGMLKQRLSVADRLEVLNKKGWVK